MKYHKIIKNFLVSPAISAFFCGSLSFLAFSPFNCFIFFIIANSGFFFLLNHFKWQENLKIRQSDVNNSIKLNFLRKYFFNIHSKIGFSFGFGYFLLNLHWICIALLIDIESFIWLLPFALLLIPAILAIYFAIISNIYSFLIFRISKYCNSQQILSLRIFVFAILWIFGEFLRSNYLLPFPWNLAGYSLLFSNNMIQTASIFGIYGVSLIAVILSILPLIIILPFLLKRIKYTNTAIYQITSCEKRFLIAIFIGIFLMIIFGYNHQKMPLITDKNFKIRLVQANIKQENKWEDYKKINNIKKHIDLTKYPNNAKYKFSELSLILWSETSIPFALNNNKELVNFIADAIPNNAKLLSGAIRVNFSEESSNNYDNNKIRIWNSAFLINNDGSFSSYDKRHLVPFGEYIPLTNFLPFIGKITNGAVDFSKGEGDVNLDYNNLVKLRPLICYEAIFNDVTNDEERADLLINITNDSWFGNSIGPYQHLAMARVRAIENGTMMARVANSGISAIIDPFGNIKQKIDLNASGVIDDNLVIANFSTIYNQFGNYPLLLLILILFILSLRSLGRLMPFSLFN